MRATNAAILTQPQGTSPASSGSPWPILAPLATVTMPAGLAADRATGYRSLAIILSRCHCRLLVAQPQAAQIVVGGLRLAASREKCAVNPPAARAVDLGEIDGCDRPASRTQHFEPSIAAEQGARIVGKNSGAEPDARRSFRASMTRTAFCRAACLAKWVRVKAAISNGARVRVTDGDVPARNAPILVGIPGAGAGCPRIVLSREGSPEFTFTRRLEKLFGEQS
jgi:hypothetical protein